MYTFTYTHIYICVYVYVFFFFINNDLTPLERQHFAALREELKLRKAAGEKDIVIRSGKIVLLPKK